MIPISKVLFLLASLTSFSLLAQEVKKPVVAMNQDLLIFKDEGSLFGIFKGFTEESKIHWGREGNEDSTTYKLDEACEILLNEGRPVPPSKINSYFSMRNGDSFPAKLSKLEKGKVTIETFFNNKRLVHTKVDLNQIKSYAPSSETSSHYSNSFLPTTGWKNTKVDYNSESAEEEKKWHHYGSAWYAKDLNIGGLTSPDLKLPNDFILEFNLFQKGYPTLLIALYREEVAEIQAQNITIVNTSGWRTPTKKAIAKHAGSALLLTLNRSYKNLTHSHYSKEKNAIIQRTFPGNNYQTIPFKQIDINKPQTITIKASRSKQKILLFINGEKISEWALDPKLINKNSNGLVFYIDNPKKNALRISDLKIDRWNLVDDPISSLSHKENDVLLLHNGLDRFSGETKKIEAQNLFFSTSYSNLTIPVSKVKQINFHQENLEDSEAIGSSPIKINFYNAHTISGTIIKSSKSSIFLKTPYLEEIEIPFNIIKSIQFAETSELLSAFVDNF